MSRSMHVVDSVLLAAWLTTVVGASQLPALTFDQHGRMSLSGVTATPTDEPDDPGPPTGPPNIQCPC